MSYDTADRRAPTQYVVLHQSVKNHPGVVAVQAAHAAAESIRSLPVDPETRCCVLVADTSGLLERLHEQLTAAGIDHVIIHEPDPPYDGAATAVGIAPVADRGALKPFVGHFKVLR